MKSPVINDPAGATTIKQTKTSLFYPFIPFPCIWVYGLQTITTITKSS